MKTLPPRKPLHLQRNTACSGDSAARPTISSQQAVRLGITQVLADRARNNQEIYRVSVLLAQLCERYHKARKEDGRPVLPRPELDQVRGTLHQAEQECAKLHALAGDRGRDDRRGLPGFRARAAARHFAVLSRLRHPDYSPAARRRYCRRPDGRLGRLIRKTNHVLH